MNKKKKVPIDAIMTEGGITVTRLAKETGLSQSFVSLLRAGKRTASQDVLCLLAEALGCSVDRLLGRS